MDFLVGLIIVGLIAYVVMIKKPEWIDLIKSKFKK